MRRAIFFTLACLLSSTPALALRYKVIDAHGNTVIPALYDSIQKDEKGRLVLTENDKHFIVDLNGRKIADVVENRPGVNLPTGCSVYYERDGYLYVRGPGGCGIYSLAGKELIPARYENPTYHGEHIFSVTSYENSTIKLHLINDAGKVISELPSWARPESRRFGDGLLNISDFSNARFVDTSGHIKTIGDNAYREIGTFSSGLAVASYRELDSWYGCYINTDGKLVLGPFKNCICSPFSDGLAIIERIKNDTEAGGSALLKRNGEFAIPFGTYDSLRAVSNNYWFATKDESRYLLRHDGTVVCKFPVGCMQISAPSQLSAESWIPCQMSVTADKSSSTELLWGYCDMSGQFRIAPAYSACSQFEDGCAEVSLVINGQDAWGVIDRQGKWILQPAFKSVAHVTANRFIVPGASGEDGRLLFESASSADRWKIFCNFLKDSDLIGMTKVELESNLGKASWEGSSADEDKSISYTLTPNVMCGNASMAIEFRLDENNKITGWRLSELMTPKGRHYITENVRQERLYGSLSLGNLVPKENP
ncbi:MAG TPA: WG repeat-containing protein [Drouetiella sp.]|jgi:WG containing repeat